MQFIVRHLGPNGVESCPMVADSAAAAQARAHREGLSVLHVQVAGLARGRDGSVAQTRRPFDVLLFSQELLALLEAGLTLTEALAALHEKETQAHPAGVLADLREALAEGRRFSEALATREAVFPPLYVGLMRSAEGTATLDQALARYIEYRQRIDQLRRHVVQALIYPGILLTVGLLVSLFLLGYVVPSFASVYQNAGRDLPRASQWLLAWGRWLAEHRALALAAGLSLVSGVAALISLPRYRTLLRERLQQGLMTLPTVGTYARRFELARLYLALGTLIEGGLPMLAALGLCNGIVSPERRAALADAGRQISEGQPASVAFESAALVTPVALRLMRVGEHTGALGDMLVRAARFHDGEIERFIARFSRSFEPLLMAGIGVLVGTIVVLLYLPIFDLAGSFQ